MQAAKMTSCLAGFPAVTDQLRSVLEAGMDLAIYGSFLNGSVLHFLNTYFFAPKYCEFFSHAKLLSLQNSRQSFLPNLS
jgi:hypothetical protein